MKEIIMQVDYYFDEYVKKLNAGLMVGLERWNYHVTVRSC